MVVSLLGGVVGLAGGAEAPVDDFGLVDDEAMVDGGGEAGHGTDGAVDDDSVGSAPKSASWSSSAGRPLAFFAVSAADFFFTCF
jgi:hypothetical protein